MYYLYKKNPNDDRSRHSSSGGSNNSGMSHGSNNLPRQEEGDPHLHHNSQHYQQQPNQLQHPQSTNPYSIPEEGPSSNGFDLPEGPLQMHPSLSSSSTQQPSTGRQSRHGRPGQEERKSGEQKDDKVGVRPSFSKRRGLEDSEESEVMQPRRPSRMICQNCLHDIGFNHHRICCSSEQERHVFCRTCAYYYVDAWIKGDADYELRQGGTDGRGHYSLPCMSPTCQHGCFPEASMQPLLTHPMFTSCRQKLIKARAMYSQTSASSGASSSLMAPQRRHSGIDQDAQPPAQRPPQQHQQYQQLYTGLSQQPLSGVLPRVDGDTQQQLMRRQPPDYAQYQRHSQQLQHAPPPPPQHRSDKQQRHDEDLLQKQQVKLQLLQQNPYAQHHPQHQHLYQQQDQLQPGAVPLPPAILRRSSTSSSATSKRTHKSTKSVRFSLHGSSRFERDEEEDEDEGSSGSSATSLTTRFPTSVASEEDVTEKEESERRWKQRSERERQRQLQLSQQHLLQQQQQMQQYGVAPDVHHHQQQQLQAQTSNVALTTCQCCFDDFSPLASPVICCDRGPNETSHLFCSKCVRTYIEEWIFGAATYTPRPGNPDPNGITTLMLPCLSGNCKDGGFPDHQVSLSIAPRSMQQYMAKITPMRNKAQSDEDRLMEMAIKLSLEQEEIQRKVSQLHEEQMSFTGAGINAHHSQRANHQPFDVNIPEPTVLSNTSSLTSFTTFAPKSSRSLPDLPKGNMSMKRLEAKGVSGKLAHVSSKEDKQSELREKSLHNVEEAMTQAKVRTCPHCQTKFLKDEDFCNKLKCPSCKTAICYICRHVIPTQGYEHFCIHRQGGCADCLGKHCPLWTQAADDHQRDMAEMRARGLDEANRIWEESLLSAQSHGVEVRVDVDSLLQQPPSSRHH